MENAQIPDPYDAVLADLRSQRERINQAIATLEALRSGKPMPSAETPPLGAGATGAKPAAKADLGPGAFLGMSIPEAAKKLLVARRQQMRTADILAELERGGLVLTSADKLNTVGSILLRRFNTVGDIVRVARGVWGLQEWYPGRRFVGSKGKPDDAAKGQDEEQEESGAGNEEPTQPINPTEQEGPVFERNSPIRW